MPPRKRRRAKYGDKSAQTAARVGQRSAFDGYRRDGQWPETCREVARSRGREVASRSSSPCATLGSQAAVPEDLKAAIMAGPKATASYCAALGRRVRVRSDVRGVSVPLCQ